MNLKTQATGEMALSVPPPTRTQVAEENWEELRNGWEEYNTEEYLNMHYSVW